MTDLLTVFTTVATREQADALARSAVEQRLAACVHIETVHSTYRWQGEICSEPEQRLLFKTDRARYAALEALLMSLHPYEVPAVFALPVVEAAPGYAGWVRDSLAETAVSKA